MTDPIDDVTVSDLLGGPLGDAPKLDAGRNCNAKQSARVSAIVDEENDTKIDPGAVDEELLDVYDPVELEDLTYGDDGFDELNPKVFVGYCGAPAGTGTSTPGEGRCKHHGGCSPSGRDSPHFKHGLFSDVLNDEDRAVMAELEGVANADMLDELIRLNVTQLRRAVVYMTDDEEEARDFFDAFDETVRAAADSPEGLGDSEIRELAGMLQSGQQAMQSKMDLVRRLVLAHSKITEGETLNVDGDMGISGSASLAVEWSGVDDLTEEED